MQVTFAHHRVVKEMATLPSDIQAHYLRILDMMETEGTFNLSMPHIRKIKQTELWEIRMKGKSGIARALFAVEENEIVIANVFIKKSQVTPKKEIDTALKRLREI